MDGCTGHLLLRGLRIAASKVRRPGYLTGHHVDLPAQLLSAL